MLEKQARYSNGEPFADPSYGPLSHASRASSPFRGAFLDAAPPKPPLKGEGDRLRWRGSAVVRLTPRPSAQAEIFYRGGTDVERELLSTGSCVIL